MTKPQPLSLQKIGVYTLLFLLLLFVQLPLLWMILTAFKIKGTAFSMNFLPRTTLIQPSLDEPPLPIWSVNLLEGSWVHVEHVDERAVDLRIESGDLVADLNRTRGGRWVGVIGPFAPGEHVVSVVADDTPPAPLTTITAPPRGEFLTPLGITVAASQWGDMAEFQVVADGAKSIAVELEDGRRFFLNQQPNSNLFKMTVPEGEILLAASAGDESAPRQASGFRIIESRSFGEALGRLYTAGNFREILTSPSFNFARYFLNSIVVATGAGIFTVLICTLAGYAFAIKEFHFREGLFAALLASMLVPGMIYMVPQFSITLNLGLMNTYAGMIVPHLGNVFGLFLMRQYIGQIPRDLFAAAEIDGAREHQVFQNIVIPITIPIMVTLFLLTFVGQWSNFLWQLIVNTGDSTVITLPVGLQQFKGQNANEWEMIMAGACFSILPIAILFLSLQRFFMEGLTAGAVKE